MSRCITRTGKAISVGRITRRSTLVRTKQRKQEKPLPTHLQCHPMRLSPTPVHPQCYSYQTWKGRGLALANSLTSTQFKLGKNLRKSGRYEIHVNGKRVGNLDDLRAAMAWQYGAEMLGMKVDILES